MAPEVVLLTTAEVAAVFRVHEMTVRRWAETGELSAIRAPGRNLRFRREDVETLLGGPIPADILDNRSPEAVA